MVPWLVGRAESGTCGRLMGSEWSPDRLRVYTLGLGQTESDRSFEGLRVVPGSFDGLRVVPSVV